MAGCAIFCIQRYSDCGMLALSLLRCSLFGRENTNTRNLQLELQPLAPAPALAAYLTTPIHCCRVHREPGLRRRVRVPRLPGEATADDETEPEERGPAEGGRTPLDRLKDLLGPWGRPRGG